LWRGMSGLKAAKQTISATKKGNTKEEVERERKKKLVTGETRANDGWRFFSISLAAGRPWLKGAIGAQVVGTRACSSGWWRQVGEPLGVPGTAYEVEPRYRGPKTAEKAPGPGAVRC
jgi:hypothetical protein